MKIRKLIQTLFSYFILILLAVFFTFPFIWVLSTSFKGPGEDLFT